MTPKARAAIVRQAEEAGYTEDDLQFMTLPPFLDPGDGISYTPHVGKTKDDRYFSVKTATYELSN